MILRRAHDGRQRFLCGVLFSMFAMALFAFPQAVHANPNDPTCWTKDECTRLGETQSYKTHFDNKGTNCTSGWGYCYPGEDIELQIHIPTAKGGVASVADLGVYIALLYRYGVRVAILAAVIAIMVGGVIWLTSSGTGNVQKARTIIGNAVIGLLIAVGSYVILQTVNPELVTLSIPRTRIIRPIRMDRDLCGDLPSGTRVYRDAQRQNDETSRIARLPCGNTFYTSLGSQCIGSACNRAKQVCVPVSASEFNCVPGTMGGSLTSSSGRASVVRLHAVCVGGGATYIDAAIVQMLDGASGRQSYRFVSHDVTRGFIEGTQRQGERNTNFIACDRAENIVGYVLDVNGVFYGRESCGSAASPITTALNDLGKTSFSIGKLFTPEQIRIGTTTGAVEGGIECNLKLGG